MRAGSRKIVLLQRLLEESFQTGTNKHPLLQQKNERLVRTGVWEERGEQKYAKKRTRRSPLNTFSD